MVREVQKRNDMIMTLGIPVGAGTGFGAGTATKEPTSSTSPVSLGSAHPDGNEKSHNGQSTVQTGNSNHQQICHVLTFIKLKDFGRKMPHII
jgi:hypothetical protein